MEHGTAFSTFDRMLSSMGGEVVDFVISVAGLLTKSDSAPGIVAAVLVAVLVLSIVRYGLKTRRRIRAISEIRAIVDSYSGEEEFSNNFEEFKAKVYEKRKSTAEWNEIWRAWDEFSETIVPDEIEGRTILRNSIRPASFLNVEDLGFNSGLYRILPNTFVSIGLLLTFLGLVAALHDFSQEMANPGPSGNMEMAMTNFMQIASAKFIMSLVGLICSILFNAFLRRRNDSVDGALHKLCLSIERRLVFVSLEDLGFRQLRAATEQREHLREIGFSMVAELRKPLDALPEQITKTLSDRMEPLFEKVSSMGAANMEGLVGDLSTQLTHSVTNALNRASESLGEASDRIGTMVDRMNASNEQAGEGLQNAIGQMARALEDLRAQVTASGETASSTINEGAEKLLGVMNETLEGIRYNTSESAQAMSAAAEEMRKSAEGFRETLSAAATEGAAAVEGRMAATSAQAEEAVSSAGRALLGSFETASQEIAKLGTEMGGAIGEELMSRIETVNSRLDAVAKAIAKGAEEAQKAASGLDRGASAISGASTSFSAASQTLVSSTEPLRSSHERIENGLRILNATVEGVAETLQRSAKDVAENARIVLDTAQTALGTEREGVRQTMEATRATLSKLSEEAEKLDEIDKMLGHALREYNSQLDAAIGSAQEHVTQMRDILAPGIDTLRSVVEQAESFMPAQARRS